MKLFNVEIGPVVKNQVLSCNQKYGLKRTVQTRNSVTGKLSTVNDIHNGVDIVSNMGHTDLLSVADGKVLYLTNNDGTGSKTVVTAHGGILPNGYVLLVLYAHCASFKVKQNDQIKKGQVIGTMGDTGNVSGVHLHCSMYAIPPEVWHTKDNTWYKWSYATRDEYVINPNWLLGLY